MALAARNFDKNGDGRISRHEAVYVRELFDTDCSGFESLSLRKQGCKSASYAIYTLYYTPKVTSYLISVFPNEVF